MTLSHSPLAKALEDKRAPLIVLMLHLLIWTAVPLLVSRNLPLDVVEALAWGREWQWGYYKHPPLSGWLAEAARWGNGNWSEFLLAQIMVTAGLAGAWLLGKDLLGARLATLALIATEGVHYFNLSSTEFNANVVMFPFWAWASLCFWRAMQSGRLIWWLLLGLCCGLGTLGKYVFLLLPASMILYTLAHPTARRCWGTAGPWAALMLFGLILAPHVNWAIQNDWPTLQYAFGRGHSDELAREGSWGQEFINFVIAQSLTLLPLWALLRALGPATRANRPSEQRWLVFTLALAPLLLIMAAATAAQAKMLHMWASPFFLCAAPLYLAWRQPVNALNTSRFIKATLAWVSLTVIVFASTALLGPQKKHRLDRTSYPGQEIAQALTTQWQARTGQPLRIVAGEEFVAGTVAHYSTDRPSVFYDADFSESLWLKPEQVQREGAVFVWPIGRGDTNMPPPPADSREQVQPLLARYPTLQAQPTLLIHTSWMGKPYTVAVVWALLPPSAASTTNQSTPR